MHHSNANVMTMYTLIHNDNIIFNMSPPKFQKIMFWSLVAPDISLIPIWIVFGKWLFGLWRNGRMGCRDYHVYGCTHIFAYHLILFGMVLRSNIHHYLELSKNHLSPMSKVILVYYPCHLWFQLFMDNSGDQGSMGSVMEHLGICSKWTTC